jgi:hypothetical protein
MIFEILAGFLAGLIINVSSVFEFRLRLEKLREGFSPLYEHMKDGFGRRYFFLKNAQAILAGKLGLDIFIGSIDWASGRENKDFSNAVFAQPTFIMSSPDGNKFIERQVPRACFNLLRHAADWPPEKLGEAFKEIFSSINSVDSNTGSTGSFVLIEMGRDPAENTF